MQGYYGQPELTDQVISGGWFVTGDMGLIDDRGRFYLKGRERDEINKGGAKVYPADVDAVVERFEPADCGLYFCHCRSGSTVRMSPWRWS